MILENEGLPQDSQLTMIVSLKKKTIMKLHQNTSPEENSGSNLFQWRVKENLVVPKQPPPPPPPLQNVKLQHAFDNIHVFCRALRKIP